MNKFGSTSVLVACIIGSVASAGAATQSSAINAAGRAEAMSSWEATIHQQAPSMEGCFRSAFPNNGWQATRCAAPPKLVSVPPAVTNGNGRTAATRSGGAFTVGNGTDYAARTGRSTRSAVGSFPSVSGVTTGVADYSLQINTDTASNPTTCSQFGYSTCQTWEQFIYSTDGDGDASNGRTPIAFIQDWFFAGSTSQYNSVGCPSGWNAYPDQNACYRNSDAVDAPLVAWTPSRSRSTARPIA